MRKTCLFLLLLISSMTFANSVPSQCTDVMFQAFYWDSYKDNGYGRTKWADLLGQIDGNNQAKEIAKWFDLVWLPPMSKATGGSGYEPICYSNLSGQWGSKGYLEILVNTLHAYGAKVVADIVANHIVAKQGWCTFAEMDFGDYGKFQPDASWICKTDEMNTSDDAGECKGKATGNDDDGYYGEANYDSGRDWDHNSQDVRNMFRAYLKWLRNDVKIDGFRYDYCKGFHSSHINDYNQVADPYFSVMEMWNANPDELQSRLADAGWNTLTFDYTTKYFAFNDGIAADNYAALKSAGLLGAGKSKYAVTFLDNHDTFQCSDIEFCGKNNSMKYPGKILQCYAYLLSMPGVPCVFYPHWVKFKEQLKPMINARYKTGVHSESKVSEEADSGFYKATITGTNGEIKVFIGPNSGYEDTPSGFTKAVVGENYGVYYKLINERRNKDEERESLIMGNCGKDYKLKYAYDYTSKILTISGNGSFDENMECGLLAKQNMTNLVIGEGVTAIGNEAFSNCANLANVQLPTTLKTIGERAFYNNLNLTAIYNYRENPCLIKSSTFEDVNTFDCSLYVLAESIAKYRSEASGWKIFYEIKPIGGIPVDEPITGVDTQPQDNNVVVTWPVSTDANTYTLQITKDGIVFCTLIFDANGQLMGIAFAPARDGCNHAPAAIKTSNGGLRFTVTGLESGTNYHLTVNAKDAGNQVIATYNSDFTTTGVATSIDQIESSSPQGGDRGRLILRNGQILILRGDRAYTITGQEVR